MRACVVGMGGIVVNFSLGWDQVAVPVIKQLPRDRGRCRSAQDRIAANRTDEKRIGVAPYQKIRRFLVCVTALGQTVSVSYGDVVWAECYDATAGVGLPGDWKIVEQAIAEEKARVNVAPLVAQFEQLHGASRSRFCSATFLTSEFSWR